MVKCLSTMRETQVRSLGQEYRSTAIVWFNLNVSEIEKVRSECVWLRKLSSDTKQVPS